MTVSIDPQITMGELVSLFPGAQRALFRNYHVGGCSSCGFKPDETLAQVCSRNENLPVAEVIQTVLAAHEADQRMQIAPTEAAELVKEGKARLIDVRSREEWDSVHIPGSTFFTQELMHELGGLPREEFLIFVCHHGVRSLDAAAYFGGHGLENVRSLRGGIDAWSCEVDPTLPHYELRMSNDLQQKIEGATAEPKNLGEMENADVVGTAGSADCGDMLRMWIKFREEGGKKVIDRATFQTFGCETAIAVASLATQLIQGKTAEEALAMDGHALSAPLGPLPPMRIHCAQLVEGALRQALGAAPKPAGAKPSNAPTLMDSFAPGQTVQTKPVRVILKPKS